MASFLVSEQHLGNQVKVIFPNRPGMAARIDVPDVWNVFFGKRFMEALGTFEGELILIAAGDPKDAQLFDSSFIR